MEETIRQDCPRNYTIQSVEQLEKLIIKLGVLPFFENSIPQYSVAEYTPKSLWFSDEQDGPWEWKGPLISMGSCVYGKLINNMATFVSLDWYPDLLNYRRALYKPTPDETSIYKSLTIHESRLSTELKKECGYVRPRNPRKTEVVKMIEKEHSQIHVRNHSGRESFDTALTKLQMGGYVVIADFEYRYSKNGERYGWGIARYTTPEALYGEEILEARNLRSPQESGERILQHLHQLLPEASAKQLLKVIG